MPVFPHPDTGAWDEIDKLSAAAPDDATATRDVYLAVLAAPAGAASPRRSRRSRTRRRAASSSIAPAGKDRTGLVTALLLRLAGVGIADIAADYAVSGDNLRERARPWIEEAETDEERRRRKRISATPAEAMAGVLEELQRRYGGVAGYLANGRRRRRGSGAGARPPAKLGFSAMRILDHRELRPDRHEPRAAAAARGSRGVRDRQAPEHLDRRVPVPAAGSRRPLRRLPGRDQRRRVPRGRRRRATSPRTRRCTSSSPSRTARSRT